MHPDSPAVVSNIPVDRVTRAVVRNQMLWTAGYSLTGGGFLTYFGYELGASGLLISLLLIVPETVGASGIVGRWVINRAGNRKRVWIAFSLLARALSLGIPLLAFPRFRPAELDPLWMMVGWLALSHAAQAVAYVSFLSWLSDLVPERNWGRFFARRNIAKMAVLLFVPLSGGLLRDWWRGLIERQSIAAETVLLAYVVTFAVGIALMTASLLPLLRFPNVPVRSRTRRLPEWRLILDAWRNRSLRFLFVHNWWLSLANGLTQAAFVGYLFRSLNVPLTIYYGLYNVMYLVQMPVSAAAGFVSDRFGNKALRFWGVFWGSSGLWFWLAATPSEPFWVLGAFVLWGAYAAANISGRNLVLKLAPRSDNSAHLSLFRQVGGLLGGLSGLAGGLWLQSLEESESVATYFGHDFGSFQLLFAVSLAARYLSLPWLLAVREPGTKPFGWIVAAMLRVRRLRAAR